MSNQSNANIMQMFGKVNPVPTETAPQEAVSSESKVNNLANSIQLKKAEIAALRAEMTAMEDELIMICGHKDEGSHKFNTEQFTITTTGKLTRSISDVEALRALAPEVVREKFELDVRQLKSLATSNPMLYKKSLSCITSKAAKTALKIEPVKAVK